MNHLLYIFLCLVLILIQTTLIPALSLFNRFYDILIVVVIFLGLYRNLREGLPVILFAGFIMDNLYNGPFGLYLTVYLWLYACIRRCSVYFNVRSILFTFLIVPAGVLFQNIIFVISFSLFNAGSLQYPDVYFVIAKQIIWAMITGPAFLILLTLSLNVWGRWFNTQTSEQKGQGIFFKNDA
jgi:cell shape-determining protein MreD